MQGNLGNTDLLNLIDGLSTSRKNGVLHLSNDAITVRIYLKTGSIVFASSNDESDRLGQILVRESILDPSDLEMALQMMESTGKHLGETLVEMGLLRKADLATYARKRVTAIIQSARTWSTGKYVFEEREISSGTDETITLMTPDVVLDEAEEGDEDPEKVLAVLGDLNNVLRQPEKPLEPYEDGSLSSSLEWILYQANGISTIKEIVAHSPLERNKTLQSICTLVSAGILQVEEPVANHPAPVPNGEESARTNIYSGHDALSESAMSPTEEIPIGSMPRRLGRYEVIELLGRGAMGNVYLANDPSIDRIVAIKLIQTTAHMKAGDLTKYKERFYQEAKSAGKLLHPGIVAVFDVGHADNDTPYIVMEHVQGRTLQEILKAEDLPVTDVIDISHSILEALGYAHGNGIVHRDIKPSNIAVEDGGQTKIMDFGIAHVVGSESTNPDEVIGSLHYMAPEQLSKEKIDQRTDLFAFGVVVFRMLTGRLPFQGSLIPEVAHSIINDPPPVPSSINPKIPPALDEVVLRCLEKDPTQRFEHAEDLRRALSSAVTGEVETSTGATGSRAKKYLNRHRRLLAAASFAALIGGGLAFLYAPSGSSTAGAADSQPSSSTGAELARADDARDIVEPSRDGNIANGARVGSLRLAADSGNPIVTEEERTAEPSDSSDADLYYRASLAFERGELENSRTQVERLLERRPSFSGAAELEAKIHMELWKEKLPISILASHDHRLGECTGTLTLMASGIRYESNEHKWDWSFFEIRILDRDDPTDLFIETHDNDVINLGKPRRYRFTLAVPLTEDDWARVQYLSKSQ